MAEKNDFQPGTFSIVDRSVPTAHHGRHCCVVPSDQKDHSVTRLPPILYLHLLSLQPSLSFLADRQHLAALWSQNITRNHRASHLVLALPLLFFVLEQCMFCGPHISPKRSGGRKLERALRLPDLPSSATPLRTPLRPPEPQSLSEIKARPVTWS